MIPLLLLLCLTSCSTPPSATPRHSAPSVAPVRAKISAAQVAIKSAQTHAARAKSEIAQAKDLVGKDAVDPANVPALHLVLEDAGTSVDALTSELLNANEELSRGEILISDLEVQVEKVTADANRERQAKEEGLEREDVARKLAVKIDAQRRAAVGQRNKLLLLTIGLGVWIARKPLVSGGGFVIRKFVGIPW